MMCSYWVHVQLFHGGGHMQGGRRFSTNQKVKTRDNAIGINSDNKSMFLLSLKQVNSVLNSHHNARDDIVGIIVVYSNLCSPFS